MRNIIMSFAEKFNGKEVKKMKSLLVIVIAIMMVISTGDLSFAAFSRINAKTYTATSGVIGGTPSVIQTFTANLRNISNNAAATSISWSKVTAGSTGWLKANQYIAVQGFATHSNWGIQVYTNNTNYIGTGDPAGLVNTSNTIFSLPMAWRTLTTRVAIGHTKLGIVEKKVSGHQVLADGTTPAIAYYPWFFMLDKRTDMDSNTSGVQPFGTHQDYATFLSARGYQHAPTDYATPWATNTTYYVYLGANFTMAIPGVTYRTTTLTVEMYSL